MNSLITYMHCADHRYFVRYDQVHSGLSATPLQKLGAIAFAAAHAY
jgi:hypothetical protein